MGDSPPRQRADWLHDQNEKASDGIRGVDGGGKQTFSWATAYNKYEH